MSKKKIDVDVSGMTIESIARLDPTHLKGLSKKSFSELTSRLVSASNKRLKRLEKSGLQYQSPAYQNRVPKGRKTARRFSVKGKTYSELQHEFALARSFLFERKTSSIAGTRKSMREAEQRIGRTFSTPEEARQFWATFKKLEEMGLVSEQYPSAEMQKDIASFMEEGIDFDEMLRRVQEKSRSRYEDFMEESGESPLEIQGEREDEEDEEDEDFIYKQFKTIKIF